MASAGIQADTHVFGSTKGYSTVAASKGVRDDERRELESFQLGEASTAARIAQLETRAVMSGRALRSGRFAISRMMPAGVDDAGRPTVEVITLVIEQRDYERCTGALQSLVTDADFWRDARERAASGALIPAMAAEAQPRDPEVLRIFDLWRAASRSGSIGVVSESDSDCLLTMVASLDPADRMRCSWGVGLLSLSTSADICSVASGVSMHGARDVMRLARDGSWHCGSESEYAAFRVSEGLRWLPSIADFERNGRELGVPEWALGSAPSAEPKRAEKRPQSLLPFAIGSAVMSTAVLAVALVMWDRRGGGAPAVFPSAAMSEGKQEGEKSAVEANSLIAPLPPFVPAQPEAVSTQPAAPPKQPEVPPPHAPATPDKPPVVPAPPIHAEASPEAPDLSAPTRSPSLPTPLPGPVPATNPTPVEVIKATLVALEQQATIAAPTDAEIQARFNGNVAAALSAACDGAKESGLRCGRLMASLIKLDQAEKEIANQTWPNDRETKAWTKVATTNGFISDKPAGGPGAKGVQNDALLRQELVEVWIKVLAELDRIVGPGVDTNLLRCWDSGVGVAVDEVLLEEKDRFWRDNAGHIRRFLISTGAANRQGEQLRAQRILKVEINDGGLEPKVPTQ